MMKTSMPVALCLALLCCGPTVARGAYSVVDTGQVTCFDAQQEITCPGTGETYFGQDAQYAGPTPSYSDNGDGTVSDLNTALMWQQSPDTNGDGVIDYNDKMSQGEAVVYCTDLVLAGNSDWRLPDIKTLYSLMNFSGEDPGEGSTGTPFIDTNYFAFAYGDTSAGERTIDAQWATTSIYVDTVMGGQSGMFGLNLADGRIKGYPTEKNFYVQCVRDNEGYGVGSLKDNGDGTITDESTSLMWQSGDNGNGVDWATALGICESAVTGGHNDWRLPNAKELQSIVDYSRSPGTTASAAIDPLFSATGLTNEAGQADYGFYWTGTTHKNSNGFGTQAVYISFGRALGYMNGQWQDVHGAGAQRSDPKAEMSTAALEAGYELAPTAQGGWAICHGPQGDVVRSRNYVRCVRDVDSGTGTDPVSDPNMSLMPMLLLLLNQM